MMMHSIVLQMIFFVACDKFKEFCVGHQIVAFNVRVEEIMYVSTNMDLIPKDDYLEIVALQAGYNSYEDMKKDGITIDDSI